MRLAALLASYEMDEPHAQLPDLNQNGEAGQRYPDITEDKFVEWMRTPHGGDCTGLPSPCIRCFAEMVWHKANWLCSKLEGGDAVTPSRPVPDWHDYFLGIASAVAARSRDPHTQIGAVVVDSGRHVVSTGYNGPPPGLNDKALDWSRGKDSRSGKYRFLLHAEINALLHARCDLRGCTLYVTGHPCHSCAKAIAAAGIGLLVYRPMAIASVDAEEREASRDVLVSSRVRVLEWNIREV